MRKWILASVACLAATGAFAADKVRFGTNWLAQGGHGGFYQALADGTYAKYGLEVEISQGGPQVNNRPMLAAGKLDFLMAGNLLQSMDNVRNAIPTIVVASYFEKDPQVLMTHQGVYPDWKSLTSAPAIFVGKDAQFSWWKWLVKDHGFKDEQLKPYGYNLAPFFNDKKMVQQGYGTAEPLTAKAQGVPVDWFLLADHGWNTYATTIEARVETVEKNPDLVQRFVDASTIGWYNYLYRDPKLGNAAILKANPEQTEAKLLGEIEAMKTMGIMGSGAQAVDGIGAIDMKRVEEFYKMAVAAGILPAGSVDVTKVATTKFVNKKVGMDLLPKQ